MRVPDPPAAPPAADPWAEAQGYFPHVCADEHGVPGFLRVRVEGQPRRDSIWSGLSYLRKYRRGKHSAPAEEVRYFDGQRRLLRWLAERPADGPRLAAVGDLMWLRDGWGDFLSPEVLAYLNGHDAVLGSLETPISPRFRVPSFWPDYFSYNSDPALVTAFRRPGGGSTFSALATASDHSLDRGDAGLADTLDFLDGQGIGHAGVRRRGGERPFAVFAAGGVRFGFYAACWGLNNAGEARRSELTVEVLAGLVPSVRYPIDLSRVRAALAAMDAEGVDFKVVYLHWGYEFEFYPCPQLMRVGRDIIHAGADLILGSHPHVVQPLEVCFVNGYERRYRAAGLDLPALAPRTGCLLTDPTGVPRKGLIAYSLGNFATAMFTPHCRTGLILSLRLARDRATGRVDWHGPEVQLVHNARRDPRSGRRRLMLLEAYLRECARAGDGADKVRRLAAWLGRHLMGEPGG
jgi:poly-gamma-glutamate synthesis protein (capsule biosynthesis protein)